MYIPYLSMFRNSLPIRSRYDTVNIGSPVFRGVLIINKHIYIDFKPSTCVYQNDQPHHLVSC